MSKSNQVSIDEILDLLTEYRWQIKRLHGIGAVQGNTNQETLLEEQTAQAIKASILEALPSRATFEPTGTPRDEFFKGHQVGWNKCLIEIIQALKLEEK